MICRLIAMQGGDDGTRSAVIAMFAQVNSLPGAQQQSAVADGQGEAAADGKAFDMGRHIVGTLQYVTVIALPLRYEMIEMGFHVMAHVGVGVFIQAQGSGRVLDK